MQDNDITVPMSVVAPGVVNGWSGFPDILPGFNRASMRALRARALRQALGYGTSEFSEMTGISYSTITMWGYADKGALSADSCNKIIESMKTKGVVVTLDFLTEGDLRGLHTDLADRVLKILETGTKLTDRQAQALLTIS